MKKNSLSRKERKNLIRIVVSLVLFLVLFVPDKTLTVGLAGVFSGNLSWVFPFALYLVVYLIIGYDVLWKAIRNIAHGQVFDENFLMCVATLGAFALAIYRGVTGQEIEGFDEACAVLLFYQVGEWFQSYATGKSRRSISSLMDIRPDYANVIRPDNSVAVIDPTEVQVGDTILVNPGEKIPLDGVVVEGISSVDTKALTGESLPREVTYGSDVISGCVNLTSQLKISVTKEFYDSTVSKILELVENASEQKSRAEICKVLYSCSLRCGIVIGCNSWINNVRLVNLDLPCIEFSCGVLSLCACYFHSAVIFCRNRCCFEVRYSDKRVKLS